MTSIIFKILRQEEWQEAKATAAYEGSADDKRDGFIHFSTLKQLDGTLQKYFKDEQCLHIIAFNADSFPASALKWETSRGGEKFPHLYTSLSMASAFKSWTISAETNQPFDLSPIYNEASDAC